MGCNWHTALSGAVNGPADRNFCTIAAMSLKSGCGEMFCQSQGGQTSPYLPVVISTGVE